MSPFYTWVNHLFLWSIYHSFLSTSRIVIMTNQWVNHRLLGQIHNRTWLFQGIFWGLTVLFVRMRNFWSWLHGWSSSFSCSRCFWYFPELQLNHMNVPNCLYGLLLATKWLWWSSLASLVGMPRCNKIDLRCLASISWRAHLRCTEQFILPGWWFGTWILLFHILGLIIPTD